MTSQDRLLCMAEGPITYQLALLLKSSSSEKSIWYLDGVTVGREKAGCTHHLRSTSLNCRLCPCNENWRLRPMQHLLSPSMCRAKSISSFGATFGSFGDSGSHSASCSEINDHVQQDFEHCRVYCRVYICSFEVNEITCAEWIMSKTSKVTLSM